MWLFAGEPRTLIHAGRLISAENNAVREEVTVVVVGDRISAIEPGYLEAGNDDQVIDLKEATLMPGLIDMHTHLLYEFGPRSYSEAFFLNPADYALRGAANAQKTLFAGFTTVRDLGDRFNVSISLRNAINRGVTIGPRIFTAAKSIGTTGGHVDPTNGFRMGLTESPGPEEGVINGPDDAFKAVRQRYKDGADLIKIAATGGVLSLAKSGQNPQFTNEELAAVMAAAKDYGMAVAVHAHGTEGMKRAVLAGVDSVEHGSFLTEEVRKLMVERGTYLVPTLMAGEWVAEKAKIDGFFPDVVRPKAAAIGPRMLENLRQAHKAGVKIAFGTDSGVSAHGDNSREFELMVEAGMTPMETILSATREAATLLRAIDDFGTVTVGKYADLVAFPGKPDEHIHLMKNPVFVMKGGNVFVAP